MADAPPRPAPPSHLLQTGRRHAAREHRARHQPAGRRVHRQPAPRRGPHQRRQLCVGWPQRGAARVHGAGPRAHRHECGGAGRRSGAQGVGAGWCLDGGGGHAREGVEQFGAKGERVVGGAGRGGGWLVALAADRTPAARAGRRRTAPPARGALRSPMRSAVLRAGTWCPPQHQNRAPSPHAPPPHPPLTPSPGSGGERLDGGGRRRRGGGRGGAQRRAVGRQPRAPPARPQARGGPVPGEPAAALPGGWEGWKGVDKCATEWTPQSWEQGVGMAGDSPVGRQTWGPHTHAHTHTTRALSPPCRPPCPP